MSISSLSRCTVPRASDQSASNQGMLMPKLKARFRIMFENFGVSTPTTELTKNVVSGARPNVQMANQVIDSYNSKVNLAGKPTWQAFTIKLRDDVTGAVSKLVGEQIQKQFDFEEQSSAAAGGNYKFTVAIEILDGGNGINTANVLERWECYGCYVTTANYNSLSYSEQGYADIDITIQPDNCIQTNTGVTPASSQRGTAATSAGK